MGVKNMGKFSVFLIIVMCCWASMAEAAYFKYKDPKQKLGVRIKDLMKRMTVEEKIGQMTQIDRTVASNEVMKKYLIGSILSGGGSVPAKHATPEQWVDMVNDFQKGSLSTRLGIPLIYGIDAVHGHNNVYKATIFPHNVGLGVTRDPALVKKIGAATALEVRATGIQYAFAPCIAVCRDPRWGRCFESYSEDPKIVKLMTEIIPGLQGDIPAGSRKGVPFVGGQDKIAACAKHYLGDGGTHLGTNEGNTIIDPKGFFSIHMPAYYDSIVKGVSTIMTSYSSWNGIKMHANRYLVNDFLKNKLKFKGIVISDWQGIDRITTPEHANYTYSIIAGMDAGIDMIMVPYNYTEFIDGLTYLVKNKFVSMSRIDDAVKRILRVKFTMGLFEKPLADYSMTKYLGSQEHRDLAREAVRKTLVLLKNGKSSKKPLLPLPKKASKILVAGAHADNLGYQCGGWTIEWQGLSGDITSGTTILSAIKSAVDPKTQVVYNENPNGDFVKSNKFDYAIVVVGEHPYAETFGDSKNLTIPEPGPSTIKNVCGAVKCVVVLISGRPVVVQPYVETIDALVAAWLPGTEGKGVTDVLFGDYGSSFALLSKMRGIFAIRRMVRNGVYCGSICSSIGEIASVSSSNPATIPYSYSCSFSSVTKPSWSIPISKFQSGQQPSNRNHCSSPSSGGSRVVTVESEAEFNTLLRKIQDESLPAVFYFTAVWCGPCRFVSPLIGELSEKYTNVTTYKIDIDQEGMGDALAKLNISAVPTLHFFQGGKKVSEIVGADVKLLKTTMEDLYK